MPWETTRFFFKLGLGTKRTSTSFRSISRPELFPDIRCPLHHSYYQDFWSIPIYQSTLEQNILRKSSFSETFRTTYLCKTLVGRFDQDGPPVSTATIFCRPLSGLPTIGRHYTQDVPIALPGPLLPYETCKWRVMGDYAVIILSLKPEDNNISFGSSRSFIVIFHWLSGRFVCIALPPTSKSSVLTSF
jgi:hypothetical protein